jgi:hypothetical protein
MGPSAVLLLFFLFNPSFSAVNDTKITKEINFIFFMPSDFRVIALLKDYIGL